MPSSESDAVIANPLKAAGLIDDAGLEKARAYQRQKGGLLSEAILRLNLVKEGDFLKTFAELYSVRFVKSDRLRTLKLESSVLERLSAPLCDALLRRRSLSDLEREYTLLALDFTEGKKKEAAELLGVDRKTLYRKLEEYGRAKEEPAVSENAT